MNEDTMRSYIDKLEKLVENLQKQNTELKEELLKLEEHYIHIVPCCNENDCGLFKEYQELKEENKRLKEAIDDLSQENTNLKNNWNELKKHLEEESSKTIYATGHLTAICMTLNKMQELEEKEVE